jgi:hypothetical protein
MSCVAWLRTLGLILWDFHNMRVFSPGWSALIWMHQSGGCAPVLWAVTGPEPTYLMDDSGWLKVE